MPKDNDVGYGKPPKHSRWKPGQSGNPKGRKKGSRGLKTDLRAELNSKVAVTENGKTVNLTKQQVVLKALASKAARGDVRAASLMVSLTLQIFGIEDQRTGKSQLSANDRTMLDNYLAPLPPSSPPPGWSEPKADSVTPPIDDVGDSAEEFDENDILSQYDSDSDDDDDSCAGDYAPFADND